MATTPEPQVSPKPADTQLYFPAPPIITSYYKYQNVNADQKLRKRVTNYFLDEIIDLIKTDKQYKKLKRHLRILKGDDGYDIIYHLLRLFVKRGDTNWYDLKIQYDLVMRYMKHKLNEF